MPTAALEPSLQPPRAQSPVAAHSLSVRLDPEVAVFLLVWILLMVAGRERLFLDPGTFWHTAVGEQMLSTGQVVRHDSFTFTFAGQPWLAHQWLGEVLLALAYRIGGWDTLLLLTATLLASVFAWLTHRWRSAGAGPTTIATMLAAVFLTSAHHYHVRPHLASIVLLGMVYSVLCDVEHGRARLSRLLWLIPLFVLWTNLHGGMLGGLATVAIVALGWIAACVFRLPSPIRSAREGAFVAGVVAVSAMTMFLSPFGADMPRTWLKIMQLSLPDVIQEHGRLDFTRPEAWMVLLLGAAYVVAVWRTPGWRVTGLVPILWYFLACDRVRHAPLFAIVAAVAGAEIVRHTHGKTLCVPRPRFSLPLAVIGACLLLQYGDVRVPLLGAAWARHDPHDWPIDLLPELRRLEQEPDARVFNTLHYGGFLAFHVPHLKTFIDDRCELFGDAFLRNYAQAERDQPQQIEVWQRAYGFRQALVRRGSPFDHFLSTHPDWRLRADSSARLFEFIGDR